MRLRRKQLGFLLNPYRHEGSTIGQATSMSGDSSASFVGASIASAPLSAIGDSAVLADSQTANGPASMIGDSTMVMQGASIASGAANASAEGSTTFYGSSGSLTCDAADFDGTNDYLTRANLTGIADSKVGTLSIWVRRDQATNAETFFTITNPSTTVNALQLFVLSSGSSSATQLRLRMTDTNDVIINCTASGGLAATATWYHVLYSWDLATSVHRVYINDVERLGTASGSANFAVDYDAANTVRVGADQFAAKFDGCVAEVYFTTEFIDVSVEENRRKFIGADGKPVDLGATGETPTGTAALVYLHLDDGETATNLAINRGTGGNFTVTGALATCASSPSD